MRESLPNGFFGVQQTWNPFPQAGQFGLKHFREFIDENWQSQDKIAADRSISGCRP
jgi:hypothetical protein